MCVILQLPLRETNKLILNQKLAVVIRRWSRVDHKNHNQPGTGQNWWVGIDQSDLIGVNLITCIFIIVSSGEPVIAGGDIIVLRQEVRRRE